MATVNDSARWMRWALVLSVALNLFLVAFLGGQAWRMAHRAATGRGPISADLTERILPRLVAHLPPADGQLVQEAFAARLPELTELQRQSREALERARLGIAQAPYDEGRVRAELIAAQEGRQKLATIVEQTLLEVLPRMSQEGRVVLSEQRVLRR